MHDILLQPYESPACAKDLSEVRLMIVTGARALT